MKKTLSIVICLSLLLLNSPFAYAEVNIGTTVEKNQYVAYVNSIIPDLSKLPNVTLPVSGLRMSQPMEIHNDNDESNYVVFLFNQDTCIGEIVVGYVDNDFCSSFIYSEIPAISNAYVNAVDVCLVSFENSLLMCSESAVIMIAGNVQRDIQEDELAQFYNIASTQGECLALTYVASTVAPAAEPPYTGLPYSSHTLDVPFVENVAINGGLCWAAATASIIRYLRGNPVVNATSVYNMVLLEALYSPGSSASVASALYNYGVTGYTYTTTTIPFQNLSNNINDGYPVYITMGGTVSGEWACHAVVVCGYFCESDGTDYIQILDSNYETDTIWISINRNTNAIRYVIPYGTGIYTTWYETVYYPTDAT